MQEIMTCQNCLIGWMESAARNFTYPLGMKTALYKKRKKVEKSPFEMYPLYWTPSKEGTFCVIRLNLS